VPEEDDDDDDDEEEDEPPPLTARTACWQADDRLATFFSRHCSAAEPPVGTLAQYVR